MSISRQLPTRSRTRWWAIEPPRLGWPIVLAAALAYCSWPLGYVLNYWATARGPASDLEATGQPYRWLFVALDVFSGTVMVVAAVMSWRATRTRGLWLFGYGLFGVSVITDALTPLDCGIGTHALIVCGTTVERYGIHDLFSLVGNLALFGALIMVIRRWSTSPLSIATGLAGVSWCACGLGFLGAVLLNRPEVTYQHYLIALTGALIILLPLHISRSRSATAEVPEEDTVVAASPGSR